MLKKIKLSFKSLVTWYVQYVFFLYFSTFLHTEMMHHISVSSLFPSLSPPVPVPSSYPQIITALEEDTTAQKMQLGYRLQQIAAAVENKVTDL